MIERDPNGWYTESGRAQHAVTEAYGMREHRRIKREKAELRNGGSSLMRDRGQITREQYLRSRDAGN